MITIDFETKSYADLQKVGAWAYSEDPTTDTICACWGIDNQPVQEWWPDKNADSEIPFDLYHAMYYAGDEVEAHNVSFERSIWTNVLARKYGWPIPNDDAWRDLMAVACYYALPAKLDRLAYALKFEGKDPEGSRLISKYSKLYLKTAKLEIPQADFDKFVRYCVKDVQIEQSISDYLGDLPARELPIFRLNQEVNLRGLHLDLEGIKAAADVVDKYSAELANEFSALTNVNTTQREKARLWFRDNGLELDNMQNEYLEEVLKEDEAVVVPIGTRRALELYIESNRASTRKLTAMASQRGLDGQARFQTRYHGAATGRETASGFQVLNLARGYDDVDPDQLVRDVMYRDPQWLRLLYGNPLQAVSKATRHWIKSRPGKRIIAGDFVSIEAVVLACLAGEEWKVKAFADRHPIYEIMGAKIHGLDPALALDKNFKRLYPAERFDGKTGELAFGYQGALKAWLNFDSSGRHTDERILDICRAWRNEHPMIKAMWYGLERAAIDCVQTRRFTSYREIGFELVDDWLSMLLPDDKRIWYFDPQLRSGMPPWHTPQFSDKNHYNEFGERDGTELNPCYLGTCDCKPRPYLTYMAQKIGQWKRVSTYGGKLTENATQATARQILFPAALRIKAAGYPIILTVYDEIVTEVDEGFGSAEDFKRIMMEVPPFATNWPINASVWEGTRYKK